jgi:phosphohistidine phosphatase
MKQLYLIRHAKSSWASPGIADSKRPLNGRGEKDAPFMGQRLQTYGVKPDLIYASPAKRARKTAEKIALAVGYPGSAIVLHDDIYTSDMNLLLAVIRQTEERHSTLFLVGHNFVITDLAEFLTAEIIGTIPTCGIVAIAFADAAWQEVHEGSGLLLFFDYPKKHSSF